MILCWYSGNIGKMSSSVTVGFEQLFFIESCNCWPSVAKNVGLREMLRPVSTTIRDFSLDMTSDGCKDGHVTGILLCTGREDPSGRE